MDTTTRGDMMVIMLPFVLSCLSFGILFTVIEVISRKVRRLTTDDTRKAAHILAGIIAACLPFWLSYPEITALGLFFIGFMAVSKKTHLFPSIHGVERLTLGEVYYPLALAIVAWQFPVQLIYTYAILVLALADGFAALVGIHRGTRHFRMLGGRKSVEGSLTCWVVCLCLTSASLTITQSSLLVVSTGSVAVAAALTLIEANLSGGLDNLALPVVAAFALSVLS
ncbi:hypothetical protein E6P97_03310 [Patescibacteria group bacterium]|nr:MAG: hypothetical protein E6P97_03310 [Patescibacteria group bacterium]